MKARLFAAIAGFLASVFPVLASPPRSPASLVPVAGASIHAARPVDGASGQWEMRNPSNGLKVCFDRAGITVRAQQKDTGTTGQMVRWETVSVGRGDHSIPVTAGVSMVDAKAANRVEIRRPGFVEWFVNTAVGLEHGYTLTERPGGCAEAGGLRLAMRVSGDLIPKVSRDGAAVTLIDSSGAEVLRYDKLFAWDATGKTLTSRMVGHAEGIALEVDDAGATYPLTIDPLFTQTAYLKASNTEAGDLFGCSVAIDGDTAVVGARDEDGLNSNAGAAYVFKLTGGTWSEQAYLKASNAEVDNRFGWSVAIHGDSIVVGAPGENGSGTAAGAAYVFVRSSNTWSQQAYLKAANADSGDRFGTSVSISGNTLIVGAPIEASNSTSINTSATNNSAPSAGAAYIFTRTGTNWTQQAYLKSENSEANDRFGNAVAISGDTAAVGADGEDGSATGSNGTVDNGKSGSGAAYVFVRSGSNWTQQAYVKASNTDASDGFGGAVALDGDTLAVGAIFESSNAVDVGGDDSINSLATPASGAAYVFTRSGTDWSQQAYVKASNPGDGDHFGTSLSISGDVLIVGSLDESSNAAGVNGNAANDDALSSGAAFVYLRDGITWTRQAYLKASNTEAFDYFGKSVAVSGATFIVGAFNEQSSATGVNGNEGNNTADDAGAAYVFLGEGDEFGVRELWGAGPDLSSNELGDLPAEQNGINATANAWSYGTRSSFLGTALTVFSAGQHQNGIGHADVDGWAPDAAVLVNKGSSPVTIDLAGETSIPVRPGQIIVEPTGSLYPVVRWTAPEAGTYNVAARWVDLDSTIGNGAAAHVLVNGVEVFGQLSGYSSVSEPTYSGLAWENGLGAAMPPQSYPLQSGDTIDFVVGPNGDATGDLTAFNAVICRAPGVTIAAPANITVGTALDVTVTLAPGTELLGACLRLNGEPVATDLEAPYEFSLASLAPGDHQLQVEAISSDRIIGASNKLLVTVDAEVPPAPSAALFSLSSVAESTATGSVYDAITSGFWDEPDIWRRRSDNAQGVPGANDVAVLGRAVQVVLRGDVIVSHIYCQGRIRGDDPQNNRELTVTEHFSIDGLVADLTLENPESGLITNVKGAAFFENVDLVNHGRMYLTSSLYSTESSITSEGSFNLITAPGSGGPIRFNVGTATLNGTFAVGPGAAIHADQMVAAGAGNLLPTRGPGLVGQDGGTLVGQDGGTLIGQDGGTLVGNDGASLVGNDGASLIGNDSAGLIGNDSAGLIGNDSAGLISDNGAILVGNDGASLAQTGAAALISNSTSQFNGGTLSGSGNLVGSVTNAGATFGPGNSPGMFFISGNFTQNEGGTLSLEIGGTSIRNPREYDQLIISGQATLGGRLVVNTLNGYVTPAGQGVPALFFESRTGTFSRISSNANLGFGANGMTLEADGPLPGPTPTLTLASSPAQVKEGKSASFIISAPAGTARPVTITYTMSGKAKSGSDYTLSPRTAVIPVGRNSVSVVMLSRKDKTTEKAESVTMTLQPRSAYLLGARKTATINILNVKAKPKK